MQVYRQLLNYLEKIMLATASVLFIIIFVVSVAEIILRNGFSYSILWCQDLCNLLTSWSMLLGSAALIHRDDHLVVDFLVKAMPVRARQMLRVCTRLILLYFCLVLGIHGMDVVSVKMGLFYTSLRWPTGLAYLALPVFGITSALFLIEKIISSITDMLHTKT